MRRAVQQLDIENFTSFIILRLWAGDIDWGGRNWYAARMRAGPDTRWRLFVWDAEATFGLTNGIDATEDISFSQVVIDSGAWGPLIPILASLMASPQYQAYFTAQVERHLAGALATESVQGRLAALGAELRPAIAAEASSLAARAGAGGGSGAVGSSNATALGFAGHQCPAATPVERPGNAAAAASRSSGVGRPAAGVAAAAGYPDCPAGA